MNSTGFDTFLRSGNLHKDWRNKKDPGGQLRKRLISAARANTRQMHKKICRNHWSGFAQPGIAPESKTI
ncbi:MAG: hypothetical protein H7039_22375 [Bryobacteraceae bacterium]|nr:hypothetical protein [Bryobacteraceae bacterium]